MGCNNRNNNTWVRKPENGIDELQVVAAMPGGMAQSDNA
jgi:hypothetical protein